MIQYTKTFGKKKMLSSIFIFDRCTTARAFVAVIFVDISAIFTSDIVGMSFGLIVIVFYKDIVVILYIFGGFDATFYSPNDRANYDGENEKVKDIKYEHSCTECCKRYKEK